MNSLDNIPSDVETFLNKLLFLVEYSVGYFQKKWFMNLNGNLLFVIVSFLDLINPSNLMNL